MDRPLLAMRLIELTPLGGAVPARLVDLALSLDVVPVSPRPACLAQVVILHLLVVSFADPVADPADAVLHFLGVVRPRRHGREHHRRERQRVWPETYPFHR